MNDTPEQLRAMYEQGVRTERARCLVMVWKMAAEWWDRGDLANAIVLTK